MSQLKFPSNLAVLDSTGSWNNGATGPTASTRLNFEGYFYSTRAYNAVYNDYAEYFAKGEEAEPGDVISVREDGTFGKSHGAGDPLVVGVCSDDFAQCIGGNGDGEDDLHFIAVGMAGRVRVKVFGPVRIGDTLIASEIDGVAMAGTGAGSIIGKALQAHDGEGIDRISALIMLG